MNHYESHHGMNQYTVSLQIVSPSSNLTISAYLDSAWDQLRRASRRCFSRYILANGLRGPATGRSGECVSSDSSSDSLSTSERALASGDSFSNRNRSDD